MTLKLLLYILGGRVRNWKQVKKNFRAVVLFVCFCVLFCFVFVMSPTPFLPLRKGMEVSELLT